MSIRTSSILWMLLLAGGLTGGVIAWLSLVPPNDLGPTPGNDKIGHLLAYAQLGALFVAASRPAAHLRAVVLCFAFGALMEVLQGIMPYGREASWADLLANGAGLAIGYGVGRFVSSRLAQRSEKA